MRLKDKVTIVTGAAHGMGEAEASLFAQEGAKVVVADVLGEQAEAVAADIRAGSGESHRGYNRRHQQARMGRINREDRGALWPARHPGE